jgi:hypothetical protein
MSYAVQPPPVAPAPSRRPVTVRVAATLLVVMAAAGLIYAVATLVVMPGTIDRFREAGAPINQSEVDGYVTVLWIGAIFAAVLAVLLAAVFTFLALGLRRGSVGARVTTWVFCGLGALLGCGGLSAVGIQRADDGTPGTVAFALSEAYPGAWIPLNIGLLIAQIAGYVLVAILLAVGARDHFGRDRTPVHPSGSGTFVALPTYGATNPYSQGPPTQAAGTSQPPAAPPAPGPDDEFWSRPSS